MIGYLPCFSKKEEKITNQNSSDITHKRQRNTNEKENKMMACLLQSGQRGEVEAHLRKHIEWNT